jgi:type I restriction enzyme M protein
MKVEEINVAANIKSKVWQALDILRQEPINSSEYNLVLYLLILQKEGLLNSASFSDKENLEQLINKLFFEFESEKAHLFTQINDIFEPTLNKLSVDAQYYLIRFLASLNQVELRKYCSEIFDDVLYKLNKFNAGNIGEYVFPLELSRFICSLVELPIGAKVYNPFAGLASFGIFLEQDNEYFGQEINQTTWAIGQLRLIAYERDGNSKFILGDSVKQWNPTYIERFDLIVAAPPFRLKVDFDQIKFYNNIHIGGVRTVEQFFLLKGLSDLKHDGKLLAVLPIGFLTSSGPEKVLRKRLIEEDILDMVISFPGGMLMNTAIPIAIVLINKNKREKGVVRFINAKDFVETTMLRSKQLNDFRLNAFVKFNTDSESLRIISNSTISEFEYNLNVSRYITPIMDIENNITLSRLGNIADIVQGQRNIDGRQGKFIRIRDLKDDKLDYLLDIDILENNDIPRNAQQISESCLLMASRWRALKPTYFYYKDKSIYITADIIALKIDESTVDIGYLINELHSDYVSEQVESLRVGITVPNLKKDDLLSIKIHVISIKEQLSKISGFKEAAVKIKLLEAEKNALAYGFGNLLYENSASLKHSMGKPLLNIGSSLRNIQKALGKLNKGWESYKISERSDTSLKETFNAIDFNLNLIHSLLKNNGIEINDTNYPRSNINIVDFIKDFEKRLLIAEKSNVQIHLEIDSKLTVRFPFNVIIIGNNELLEVALNNIVENANRHAFVDNNTQYKLFIKLDQYINYSTESRSNENSFGQFDYYLKIEISNNGQPFPENYSLEKLIRKNSSAGPNKNSGLGGYQLNEIAKYHQGWVDLITGNTGSEFVTTYELYLPISIEQSLPIQIFSDEHFMNDFLPEELSAYMDPPDEIEDYIDSLHKENEEIENYLDSLNKENEEIENYLTSLNNEDANVEDYLTSLGNEDAEIENYSTSLDTENETIDSHIDSLIDESQKDFDVSKKEIFDQNDVFTEESGYKQDDEKNNDLPKTPEQNEEI